jgi:hypothetical protein
VSLVFYTAAIPLSPKSRDRSRDLRLVVLMWLVADPCIETRITSRLSPAQSESTVGRDAVYHGRKRTVISTLRN